MALQRAVCRNTWTTIGSIQFVFLPILLALQQSHTIGDGGTCSADPFTCSEHGWTEVGGARTILGLQPQRLVVGETSEIFISVKTAAKYHEQRLSLLLLTWLQTLQPHQVHIVTDDGAEDQWTTTAMEYGFDVVSARGCSVGHCRECLCCKSGVEYEQFYRAREGGSQFKWFCHVDDDVYVNVEQLVRLLKNYDPESEKVYLGRWSLAQTTKLEIKPFRAENIPNLKTTRFGFGTGALYCISSSIMAELEPYFSGSERFVSTCKLFQYTDDMTVGATIEAILGYNLTDVDLIASELHSPTNIPDWRLPYMVSISHGEITLPGGATMKRHVTIPHAKFSLDQDPTRFLSYHCLIHPTTSWCSG